MPTTRVIEPTLVTDKAGTLKLGDEFMFQEYGEGGQYGTFTFHGHVLTDDGYEHVDCFGGASDPKGCREWRAFAVERVVARAKPTSRVRRAANARRLADKSAATG